MGIAVPPVAQGHFIEPACFLCNGLVLKGVGNQANQPRHYFLTQPARHHGVVVGQTLPGKTVIAGKTFVSAVAGESYLHRAPRKLGDQINADAKGVRGFIHVMDHGRNFVNHV